MRFKRKRKIANAKIYEDKRDLYCSSSNLTSFARIDVKSSAVFDGYVLNESVLER